MKRWARRASNKIKFQGVNTETRCRQTTTSISVQYYLHLFRVQSYKLQPAEIPHFLLSFSVLLRLGTTSAYRTGTPQCSIAFLLLGTVADGPVLALASVYS